MDPGDGLFFAGPISTTQPGGVLFSQMATADEEPTSALLVEGYDAPPVGVGSSYLATLIGWDELVPGTTSHRLTNWVGTNGITVLGGGFIMQPGPDLACASETIAAAGARVGQAWLVAVGAGSELTICDGSAQPPTLLALDLLTWESGPTVGYTLARVATFPGTGSIEAVAMASIVNGAWILATRGGQPQLDLLRVDAGGTLQASASAPETPQGNVVQAALAPIQDGLLVAVVEDAAPAVVTVELRDSSGVVRGQATIAAQGPVASLSLLESKDGTAALIAWTTATSAPGGAVVQIARIGCEGGS